MTLKILDENNFVYTPKMFGIFEKVDLNDISEYNFLMNRNFAAHHLCDSDEIDMSLLELESKNDFEEQHSRYNPTDFHRFLWCKLNISKCHTHV